MAVLYKAFLLTTHETFIFLNVAVLWTAQCITFLGFAVENNIQIFIDIFFVSIILTTLGSTILYLLIFLTRIFELYAQQR